MKLNIAVMLLIRAACFLIIFKDVHTWVGEREETYRSSRNAHVIDPWLIIK